MGKYKAEDVNAECADFWKINKQRAQACVATGKDAVKHHAQVALRFFNAA